VDSGTTIEALTNPRQARLLIEIYANEKMTAKQLSDHFPEIPVATLYRYLKKMCDKDILRVVETRPRRGTVEKVYAVTASFEVDTEAMLKANDGQAYATLFNQFALGIMNEFRTYASRPGIDILHDGSGFTVNPVYATLDELTDALMKIREALTPLADNPPSENRKLHNICVITTPPTD